MTAGEGFVGEGPQFVVWALRNPSPILRQGALLDDALHNVGEVVDFPR